MIFPVIDYHQLYKLSRLIDMGEFKDIDFTAETFFHYLIDRFDVDRVKVFVSSENREINGFVICSLSEDVVTQRPEVFIDLAWVKRGSDGKIGQELLKKVEEYARALKLNRISGFTLRGQEGAMFKKYGFRKYSVIMVKDLDGKDTKAEPMKMTKVEKNRLYYQKNRDRIIQRSKKHYELKKLKNSEKAEKREESSNAEQKEEDRT